MNLQDAVKIVLGNPEFVTAEALAIVSAELRKPHAAAFDEALAHRHPFVMLDIPLAGSSGNQGGVEQPK